MASVITTTGQNSIVVSVPADQHHVVGDSPVIASVSASGGTPAYTYSVYQGGIGDLTLNSSTGAFSGSITNALTANNVYFIATDADGGANINGPVVFEFVAALALTNDLGTGKNLYPTNGDAFSFFLTAENGRPGS